MPFDSTHYNEPTTTPVAETLRRAMARISDITDWCQGQALMLIGPEKRIVACALGALHTSDWDIRCWDGKTSIQELTHEQRAAKHRLDVVALRYDHEGIQHLNDFGTHALVMQAFREAIEDELAEAKQFKLELV